MKKLLLLLCIGVCSFQVNAQEDASSYTSSGTIMLNGSSSLNISFADGTPTLLGLGAGYFLMDNLAAGLNFQYFSFDGNSDTATELFARYYVMPDLFAGLAYQLNDPTVFSASVGYNFFIGDMISLEPTFTYPFKDIYDPELGIGVSVFLK